VKQYFLILFFLVSKISILNPAQTNPEKTYPGEINLGPIVFEKTAFASKAAKPTLFIGVKKDITKKDLKKYALSSISLGTPDEDGNPVVKIDPLAKSESYGGDDSSDENPLKGKKIYGLTVQDDRYAIAITKDTKIYKIKGTTTNSTPENLKDSGDGEEAANETKKIAAIAASPQKIFAAVSAKDKDFGDSDGLNRGIAIIGQTKVAGEGENASESIVELAQVNPKELNATGTSAAKISLKRGGQLVALSDGDIEKALIGNTVCMCWDPHLKRLFVGLNDVRRDKNEKEGGVVALLVGRIDEKANANGGEFILKPIVQNPTKSLFYDVSHKNKKNLMLGFYFDGQDSDNGKDEISCSIKKMVPMRTSTGKSYLIVNCIMNNPPKAMAGGFMFADSEDWICALPLISAGDESNVGTIAQVNVESVVALTAPDKEFQLPGKVDQMPQRGKDAVDVGGAFKFSGFKVQDISTVGDSVYVCRAGTKGKYKGVFKSTAIFDADGNICNWTPARRAYGFVKKTFGGGLDTDYAQFYALTSASNEEYPQQANTGRITEWVKGDKMLHDEDEKHTLGNALGGMFGQEKGGVLKVESFHEHTYGFKPGRFSMMVALGFDKAALIQSGSFEGRAFVPTEKFEAEKTIFSMPTTAGKPLTCATTAVVNKEGCIFVGGRNGIEKTNSTNWKANVTEGEGLSELDKDATKFPGNKELVDAGIADIKNVVAMTSDIKYLYILTNDKLYCHGDISTGGSSTKVPVSINNGFDLVFAGAESTTVSHLFVASTSGLTHIKNDNGTLEPRSISNPPPGQVMQMQYLSGQGNDPGTVYQYGFAKPPGNLYVLTLAPKVDMTDEEIKKDEEADEEEAVKTKVEYVPQVYRYAVDENFSVEPIDKFKYDSRSGEKAGRIKPYLQLEDFRRNFATDGSVIFNLSSKSYDGLDFARVGPVSDEGHDKRFEAEQSLLDLLDIDDSVNYHVSPMMNDHASGCWIIPGDWGIRMSE
jgi:hypothetical protein